MHHGFPFLTPLVPKSSVPGFESRAKIITYQKFSGLNFANKLRTVLRASFSIIILNLMLSSASASAFAQNEDVAFVGATSNPCHQGVGRIPNLAQASPRPSDNEKRAEFIS